MINRFLILETITLSLGIIPFALVFIMVIKRKINLKFIYIIATYLFFLGVSTLRRNYLINLSSKYHGSYALKNYYGKKNCIIKITPDFKYLITCDNKTINEGYWDLHEKKAEENPLLLLTINGNIFGLNHLEIQTD